MTKKQRALEIIERLKKEYPGCRMHSGLRSGMETACQCPPGSSVYRCPGKYRSGKAV